MNPVHISIILISSVLFAYFIQYNNNSNMTTLAAVRAANSQISLIGKQSIVVGGTSGIGHGIAKRLAQAGCSVTIVGRSERGIVEELNSISPPDSNAQHKFVPVNAYLLSSVDVAVNEISSTHEKIDYLVQSQGMATIQGFTPSPEEGLDQKLTLHVYSRASFCTKLLPLLLKSDNPRSISILSAGVHSPYTGYKNDLELINSYSIKNAADSAGFYNDILADGIATSNPQMTMLHAAPGFVRTRWGTEMPWIIRWPVRFMQRFGRSQEDCASYMFNGLTNATHTNGFHLLNEYGAKINKVTNLHEEAKEFVFTNIMKIVETGKSLATTTGSTKL